MKKKIVSLLLTGVMAAGVLAGCGGQSIADQQAAGDTTADSAEGEAAEETVTMAAADEVDGTEITFWHSMGGRTNWASLLYLSIRVNMMTP